MTVVSTVTQALKVNDQARNSDKVLLLQVWHNLGLNLTIEQQKKFLELPSPETIRRIRQKLQEDGKFVADSPIKNKRDLIAMTIQQNIPNSKPERIESLLQGNLL